MLVLYKYTGGGPPAIFLYVTDIFIISQILWSHAFLHYYIISSNCFSAAFCIVPYVCLNYFSTIPLIQASGNFRYSILLDHNFNRPVLPYICSNRRFQRALYLLRYIYRLCKLMLKSGKNTEALFCVLSDFIFSFDILYLWFILLKSLKSQIWGSQHF